MIQSSDSRNLHQLWPYHTGSAYWVSHPKMLQPRWIPTTPPPNSFPNMRKSVQICTLKRGGIKSYTHIVTMNATAQGVLILIFFILDHIRLPRLDTNQSVSSTRMRLRQA